MSRILLFDLGDTLMHARAEWPPILALADKKLAEFFCKAGLELDCAAFHDELHHTLRDYYALRDRVQRETTILEVLRSLLAKKGFSSLPDSLLRPALAQRYAITQQNWEAEEDALPVLRTLHQRGFRLGIVSNAGDHQDVLDLINAFNLTPLLDLILTSAECGYRKPHPRIFAQALEHWRAAPADAVMIGDRLDTDIAGARAAGIFAIWLTRRASRPAQPFSPPDATVDTLEALLRLPLLRHPAENLPPSR